MKCEVCLELLEEYLDGELASERREQIGTHLISCADCSAAFTTLGAEQELFARYDREVEVPPFLWTRVAAHIVPENNPPLGSRARFAGFFAVRSTSFAGAIAILLLAIAVGVVYLLSRQPAAKTEVAKSTPEQQVSPAPQESHKAIEPEPHAEVIAANPPRKRKIRPAIDRASTDQSDVLSADAGYLDMDERDTAKHIEQTQNLLRSIRNVPVSDGDDEIDVSYDKALSRRLLNENVVLRRDAEMKAKFPTKTLLADLEPFLIDIANLPDRARPEDVRVIKERVQKTEIVAALLDYQDRGTNNR
jgi:Putative zinc-finger